MIRSPCSFTRCTKSSGSSTSAATVSSSVSPVYTYLTVRARSVLAATFLHGSFNGLGALSLVYLAGGGNLLVSPVGVAGVGAALLATAVCLAHDRYVATTPITTGGPLRPWGLSGDDRPLDRNAELDR